MTYDEALNKVSELRTREGEFSTSDKEEISSLYRIVFRKDLTVTNCKDCYNDALILIYNELKRERKMKEESSYALKNGVILQPFGSGKVYTNANLTDEVVEEHLKKFPKFIGMLSKYPNDWKKRAGIEVEEAEKLNDELVAELAAKLKDGTTKTALKEVYKGFQIEGKAITARTLDAYIKAADLLK